MPQEDEGKPGKSGGNGETIFRFSFKTAKAIAVTCRWFTFGSNPTITQKTQPSQQTEKSAPQTGITRQSTPTKRQRTPDGRFFPTTPLTDGSSSSSPSSSSPLVALQTT